MNETLSKINTSKWRAESGGVDEVAMKIERQDRWMERSLFFLVFDSVSDIKRFTYTRLRVFVQPSNQSGIRMKKRKRKILFSS